MTWKRHRATLMVMLGLAAASLTGFVRQAAIAHQLGTARAADMYLVAFVVPEFAFIALPIVLSPALIPLFAERQVRRGPIAAWRFGVQVAGALLVLLLAFAALAGLGAPLYAPLLAPGFDAHERGELVQAARRMMPAVVLMGLATLCGTWLQVYRRFARPALATAIYNLAFVLTLFLLPLAWPVGRAAWGVTVGAGAALLVQAPLLWQLWPRPLWSQDGSREPLFSKRTHDLGQNLRQAASMAGPLLAGYVAHHAILVLDRAMATKLEVGHLAALSYAYHLALVIAQLSGLAVSTTLFPGLAERVVAGDMHGVRGELAAALRFVWLIGLPATCGLIVMREPIVRVLFERGAFDAAGTQAVHKPLVWYSLAALADALCQPLWRVVYAQRRPWTVLAVNALQTGVRLSGNWMLVPALGYNGLALSAAIGLTVQAAVLAWWVRRQIGRYLSLAWCSRMARIALATAVASGAVGLLMARLSN